MRTFFLTLCVLTASVGHVRWRKARRRASGSMRNAAPAIRSARRAKNLVGPQLNGMFGRKSGTVEGYNYTDANKNANITWDEKTFSEYIVDPRARFPAPRWRSPASRTRSRSRT